VIVTFDDSGKLKIDCYVIILKTVNIIQTAEYIQRDINIRFAKNFNIKKSDIGEINIIVRGIKSIN